MVQQWVHVIDYCQTGDPTALLKVPFFLTIQKELKDTIGKKVYFPSALLNILQGKDLNYTNKLSGLVYRRLIESCPLNICC